MEHRTSRARLNSSAPAPVSTLTAGDDCLSLPELREPVGWRTLQDSELQMRAELLYASVMQKIDPLSLGAKPQAPSCAHDSPKRRKSDRPLEAPTASTETSAPGAQSSDPRPESQRSSAASTGRLLALPVLVFLGGGVLSAPVLVWAPLLGGLSLGMVLLQCGLLYRWNFLRHQGEAPADQAISLGLERPNGLNAPAGNDKDRAALPRLQGWTLFGALGLLVAQMGVLIATIDIKNREPAAAASAMGSPRMQAEPYPGASKSSVQKRENMEVKHEKDRQ